MLFCSVCLNFPFQISHFNTCMCVEPIEIMCPGVLLLLLTCASRSYRNNNPHDDHIFSVYWGMKYFVALTKKSNLPRCHVVIYRSCRAGPADQPAQLVIPFSHTRRAHSILFCRSFVISNMTDFISFLHSTSIVFLLLFSAITTLYVFYGYFPSFLSLS